MSRPPAIPSEWADVASAVPLSLSPAESTGNAAPALTAAVERLLAAADDSRKAALRDLVARMKTARDAGDVDLAVRALRAALVPTLDFTAAQSLLRFRQSLPPEATPRAKIKLAILGSFTTHQLRDLTELFLFAAGIGVEVYEGDFGVFRQELLDPTSGLYAFAPDIVYVATHWRDLGHRPTVASTAEDAAALLDAEYDDWALLWRTAHDRLGCQIVQNNFDTPPWRALGNHELRHPAALTRFIAQANLALAERAPPYVTIHDVEWLESVAGRRAWADERYFLHAKLPCAPEYLVDYAHSVASIIAAQRGLSRKCLVLDLDNTLWGGVIGDDGMRGIRIGQGDAEGEAFASFQHYAKALAMRGVILAVCSKNTDAIAREVFESHPDMVLRLDDIACFVANWNDKAANLRHIARTLNIGLDSLVFVDDNPAERSIVRQLVPEVAVPEVTADPGSFIDALERHRYFQVVALGADDLKRAEYYRTNAARAAVASASGGVEDFLQSLAMRAVAGPITDATLERATQLINKSNQFNLTTRRKSTADVLAAMTAPDWVTLTVSLADRFGDNGLISVVLAKVDGDTLDIDTWLMSCRVLKRGVERFLLNLIVAEARARGLSTVRGEFIPTPKNALVRDHYAELGFTNAGTDADGRGVWHLSVADFAPLSSHIAKA